jgi:uncharacterized protein YkwD
MNRVPFFLALLAFASGVADAQVQSEVDRYRSGDAMVTIECFAPAARGKFPAVLLLHASGGLDATADVYRGLANDLASQGYVVYFPHYFERTGHVTGRPPAKDIPLFNEAISDAVEFAAANPRVDADRIGLLGYSLGSYLAFYQAERDERIKAIVSCSGRLSVVSNSKFPPVLILQGSNDPASPVEKVKEFQQSLDSRGIPSSSHIYRRTGHNFDLSAWSDASRRAVQFFNRYLKGVEPRRQRTAAPASRPATEGDKQASATADALLAAHNRERQKDGRGPLVLSDKLSAAAAVHAKDMAAHRKLDHTGSDSSTAADRIKRQGYVYIDIGENIADGQESVAEVMNTWMTSPPHRENVLGNFTEMGTARVEGERGVAYWCVDFGKPMPSLKPAEAAAAVVKAINKDRRARHKPALKADSKLGKAAVAYAAAMAAKDTLKLQDDPLKVMGSPGAPGRELLLKLSANVPTPEEVTKSLVGETAKETDPFEWIGVGYAVAKSGTPYWCAIFSKPIPEKPRAVRLRERQVTSEKKQQP